MSFSVDEKQAEVIKRALRSAEHLIAEEGQSLVNEDLKEEYETVLTNLDEALKIFGPK